MNRKRWSFDGQTVAILVVCVAIAVLSTMISSSRRGRSTSSTLAAHLARKSERDEFWLRKDKHEHWYHVDLAELGADIRRKFVVMSEDEATSTFVANSVELSDSWFLQTWHSLAKAFMSPFFTQTDINGYLGRGSMFVLSERHFERLLEHGGVDKDELRRRHGRLIDLGAGDGRVTDQFRSFFANIFATETSNAMKRILQQNDVTVLPIDSWSANASFDMIACLNLLDRCDKPLEILSEAKKSLKKPGGLLLVALVLPFNPYVEVNDDHLPSQKLDINGRSYVDQVPDVVKVFEGLEFRLLSWTRLPYLCEGDLANSIYTLDDAVFLFAT